MEIGLAPETTWFHCSEIDRQLREAAEQMEVERRRRLEEVRKKEEEHRLALEERKKRMQIEEQV